MTVAVDTEITALMRCLQGEREHVLGAERPGCARRSRRGRQHTPKHKRRPVIPRPSAAPGLLYPVNYSAGWSDNGVTVPGLAEAAVSRIDHVPAPGRNPVALHLDRTNEGDQAFEFTAGDTTYAQLIVYGPGHQPLRDYGAKLRTG